MKKQTINAIMKRIQAGESRFFIGRYLYEASINGIIRRREQCCGQLPTSDWERIGSCDPVTGAIKFA